jgi:hypothetical protein
MDDDDDEPVSLAELGLFFAVALFLGVDAVLCCWLIASDLEITGNMLEIFLTPFIARASACFFFLLFLPEEEEEERGWLILGASCIAGHMSFPVL